MCISPLTIDNPNFSEDRKNWIFRNKDDRVSIPFASVMKYTNLHSRRIQVPCGHCPQCTSLRQGYFMQRVQMESLRSYLFFMTLTYDDAHLPVLHYKDYHHSYANYNHIQMLMRRFRDHHPLLSFPDGKGVLSSSMRYMCVSEFGKKRRAHYHVILALDKRIVDPTNKDMFTSLSRLEQYLYNWFKNHWAINVSKNRKKPVYEPLYRYVRKRNQCTFDLHYIEPICNHDNDVSFYITKYVLKYDETTHKLLSKIRLDPTLCSTTTDYLISILKPRCVISKDFGDRRLPYVRDYILKNYERDHMLPQYVDINTGKTMLLSPYYRKLVPMEFIERRFYEYSKLQDTFYLPDTDDWADYFTKGDHKVNLSMKFKKTKINLQSKFI